MYLYINDITKGEIKLQSPINNLKNDKQISLIKACVTIGFYNLTKDESISVKQTGKPDRKKIIKAGLYSFESLKREIESICPQGSKIEVDKTTGQFMKTLLPTSTTLHLSHNIEQLLGSERNWIVDMLQDKKILNFECNIINTYQNLKDGSLSDILYTSYLNKEINFGDTLTFEPINLQYKQLRNEVIRQS